MRQRLLQLVKSTPAETGKAHNGWPDGRSCFLHEALHRFAVFALRRKSTFPLLTFYKET